MAFPPEFLDELRHRVALTQVIGRRVRLVQRGREFKGLCPFHDEKTPSFTVNEDKGFFHCFGCGAHGDVIDFIAHADNLTFPEAVKRLSRETTATRARRPAPPCSGARAEDQHQNTEGTLAALSIWQASQPAANTVAEAYLRGRAITLPVPPSLRFHQNLTYTQTGTGFPAVVAGVQAPNRTITAIHRTFLLPDGRGKAQISKPKMALGPIGNGAVRLAKAGPVLGLAEGIETALSAMQLFDVPTWAALGSRMHQVALPEVVREIVIYADNGGTGLKAANKAIDEFTSQGCKVTVRWPPTGYGDWNDALQALQQEQSA